MRGDGLSTSIGSLSGVLFFAQIILLLTLGAHAQLTLLREQTDVRLEVLETDLPDRIGRIGGLVNALQREPYVEDVLYVTRSQAYERMKSRDPELIAFLEEFDIQNPFPETIGIRLKNLEDYQNLVLFLRRPEFEGVVDPDFLRVTDQEYQVRNIYNATVAARSFLLAVIAILTVVLVFVLIELVRRRVVLRREEILIQQLVGATPLTILLPFGMEILVLLLAGLALSLVAIGAVILLAPLLVPALQNGDVFGPWVAEMKRLLSQVFPWIVLIEVLLLPFFAFLGSFFGLMPRMRRPTLSMS